MGSVSTAIERAMAYMDTGELPWDMDLFDKGSTIVGGTVGVAVGVVIIDSFADIAC